MLLTIFLLLSSTAFISFCDISMEQAANYLDNYGYLKTTRSSSLTAEPDMQHYPVTSIRDALKNFQKYAGLKTTGELDEPTKKKMQQKRCGRPDVMELRRQDDAYKWNKNDLTYSIDSYPNELSEREVSQAVRRAFDTWSAVTPLVFSEVAHDGDIIIRFARRAHGDPWPFDGRGGVLAHATLPPSGMLHFDSDEKWAYMDPRTISNFDTTDVLPVAIHEIGHVLGLEHSVDSKSIMAAFYKETVDNRGNYIMPKLSASDIESIQHLYGGFGSGRSKPRDRTTGPPKSSSSNGSSFWDRIKGFFGSSSHDHDDTADSRHNSDFHTDSPDVTDSSGHDRNAPKSDGSCPDEVDSVITVDGTNYLFSNSKVYEFGRSGIEKEYSLKSLFPNAPPFVQGALSNLRTGRTLLFQSRMVFGYHYDPNKGKFVLEEGYPKRLPADLDFNPMGAFLWSDGSQIILNGNHFAIYDENWNRVTLRNEVRNYFDNFPAEPVRGVLINRTKMLVFGNNKVYKYDRRENKVVGDGTPLRAFLRCQ